LVLKFSEIESPRSIEIMLCWLWSLDWTDRVAPLVLELFRSHFGYWKFVIGLLIVVPVVS